LEGKPPGRLKNIMPNTKRMKIRASGILSAILLTTMTFSLSAQEEIETETPALIDWRQVLAEYPDSTEDLFIRAEAIYTELFRTTGEKAYIDSVLMILSQRTLYFNNKPANDLHKSLFLFENGGNDPMYVEECYNLIKEVADSFPDHIDHISSVLLMAAAARSYSFNIIDTTDVLAAYLKASGTVETQLEIHPGDSRYSAASNKIDSIFRAGGAMTCSSIEVIYSRKVDQNHSDTVLINKVFNLLTEMDCTRSDFYYRLAVRIYANNRSAENAVRLAELNIARNNRDKAVGYFTEAFKADTSKTVQSDVLIRVAEMELAEGKRQEARDRGEHAWQLNKKNGEALMIIAEACAGSKIGDAFDNHSVYWVAVDYLMFAKAVEPSLKETADAKIKAWSRLFPTREECYYRGITDEGIVYSVGGWISEVTKVRFRKE
jgi:tetratricopeptide (TPR) repeat protein